MAFSVAAIVTLVVLRWYGLGFEYRGHLAQATHELRLATWRAVTPRAAGEAPARGRAGEMNALLLGSVDENLNYVIAIANILLLIHCHAADGVAGDIVDRLAAGAGDVADLPLCWCRFITGAARRCGDKCRRWGSAPASERRYR